MTENKKLSLEQMDKVTGGTAKENYEDMAMFKEFGIDCGGDYEKLRDAFYKYGIKLKDHGGFNKNDYYRINPDNSRTKISRTEAYEQVKYRIMQERN